MLEQAAKIAKAFTTDQTITIAEITDGAVNASFEIKGDHDHFILQRMGAMFAPYVMDTLELIIPYAAHHTVVIPSVRHTLAGERFLTDGEEWWRALSYVEGETKHDSVTAAEAHSAARLVGSFHNALSGVVQNLPEPIPDFHNTPRIMERLLEVHKEYASSDKDQTLGPLVKIVTEAYEDVPAYIHTLPKRIIHGDLKISNIRLDAAGEAIGLIDMDTVMRHTVAVEMGDAIRSWAGVRGEDDAEQVFDNKVAKAALDGYVETADFITNEEKAALVDGIALLTIELAARFVIDAYEESYFAQSSRYTNLYEQNKTKAENQLALYRDFLGKRSKLTI